MQGMGLKPDDLDGQGGRRTAAARPARTRTPEAATPTRAPRIVRRAPAP
jgi:hypothetical protein